MNKPELERHCTAMREAINQTVLMIRTKDGHCTCCEAVEGQQHRSFCAVCPIIMARGDFAMAHDGQLMAVEDPVF